MTEYQEYKKELLRTLRDNSAISGTDTEDEFVNHALDLLKEYDELQEPQRLNCGNKPGSRNRIMRIDGYSIDDADHSLILFISDFEDAEDIPNLTMSRVDELYWKMFYFLDETCNGKINDFFDDSDDVLKAANYIKSRLNVSDVDDAARILKIRFLILTNREIDPKLMNQDILASSSTRKTKKRRNAKSTKKIKKDSFNDMPLEIDLWHMERMYDQEKLSIQEKVQIDLEKDFGSKGIPCIKGDIGDDLGYNAYIAIVPGKLLADIYIEYGSKVLEGNVRAFLGTSGSKSVNSGIRRTIYTSPKNFFTFNNGIATTAADIEIKKHDGQLLITKIDDLQIINGGQTTASLAEAVLNKANPSSLDGIFVPMKLTVIEDRDSQNEDGVSFYDEMVHNIAKYANSQNKVTAADLFSNDPFHIKMEKMSKIYLAPPRNYPTPTGWYYERSRKKYKQEQMKFKPKSDDLKRFLLKFPKEQIVSKEQMAMYLTAAEQRPHIVAKGKIFVIKEFNQSIREKYSKNKEVFNEFFFHKCIASAIIYRSVDGYLEKNKDCANNPTGFWYKAGGFKMDIVPYAISKIFYSIPEGMSVNWEEIWQRQQLAPGFMKEIARATKFANDFINDSHGVIVSEYCKKESTWTSFKEKKYTLTNEFLNELIPDSIVKEQEKSAIKQQTQTTNLSSIVDFIKVGPKYWTAIKKLAESRKCATNTELSYLDFAVAFAQKNIIPNSNKIPVKIQKMMDACYEVKKKLLDLGVKL